MRLQAVEPCSKVWLFMIFMNLIGIELLCIFLPNCYSQMSKRKLILCCVEFRSYTGIKHERKHFPSLEAFFKDFESWFRLLLAIALILIIWWFVCSLFSPTSIFAFWVCLHRFCCKLKHFPTPISFAWVPYFCLGFLKSLSTRPKYFLNARLEFPRFLCSSVECSSHAVFALIYKCLLNWWISLTGCKSLPWKGWVLFFHSLILRFWLLDFWFVLASLKEFRWIL